MIWVFTVFLVTVLLLLRARPWRKQEKRQALPPGPTGLPILGHLHLLGSSPHRALHRLSQKYGPVMFLRLGFVPTVVVSSPQAAELFLKAHDLVYADRPCHQANEYLCWGNKCLSFSRYGAYWRNIRRICTVELLGNLKVNSYRNMRKEELDLLIKLIKEEAREGKTMDLSARVSSLSADMSCRMIFGRKYVEKEEFDERGFRAIIQQGMQLTAAPNMADYFPLVGAFDLQGLSRRMKALCKVHDDFFDRVIDEHICNNKTKKTTTDLVDSLLGFVGTHEDPERPIDRSHIKAILLDMLVASVDTSSAVIVWTLSELIKNPKVMNKLQKELETVVGRERTVEESDLEKLQYLDMVVKESLRLHAVLPLLLPHQSMEDCVVGEKYFIPRNCRVIVNAWAIMRDSSVWSEAERFWPERFEGTSVDVRGRDFEMIPFGSGRRGCPGMQLGLTVVRLVVAQLVHCFEWKLPDDVSPDELDMTEEFNLTAPRARHLLLVPTYRLRK